MDPSIAIPVDGRSMSLQLKRNVSLHNYTPILMEIVRKSAVKMAYCYQVVATLYNQRNQRRHCTNTNKVDPQIKKH
jgi:hypothetical protein